MSSFDPSKKARFSYLIGGELRPCRLRSGVPVVGSESSLGLRVNGIAALHFGFHFDAN